MAISAPLLLKILLGLVGKLTQFFTNRLTPISPKPYAIAPPFIYRKEPNYKKILK